MIFRLVHREARHRAQLYCVEAPDGTIVRFEEPTKSREQEEKYHAMFADIAKTCKFMGEKQDSETWKRLLVDAFARIKAAEGEPLTGYGRVIPSLDGLGVVQLGFQTRKFKKVQASEFIEYLHAFGAQNDVLFRYSVAA